MYHLYLSSDICGADIANKASVLIMQRVVLIMQRVVLNLRTMVLTRANIQNIDFGILRYMILSETLLEAYTSSGFLPLHRSWTTVRVNHQMCAMTPAVPPFWGADHSPSLPRIETTDLHSTISATETKYLICSYDRNKQTYLFLTQEQLTHIMYIP